MKASEARNISEKQAITLQMVLEAIKQNAHNGDTSHFLPPNKSISPQLIADLIGLGYSVKQHEDPFNGFKTYVISW